MSNIAHDLIPDVRLVAQVVIFGCALLSANYFIIQPSLRLHRERKKRTAGSIVAAKNDFERLQALESSYHQELKSQMDAANNLRLAEVHAGQSEAESIAQVSAVQANDSIVATQQDLKKQLEVEKQKIHASAQELTQTLLKELGVVAKGIFFALCGVSFFHVVGLAESEAATHHGTDFWYGIFWPYYQTIAYLIVLVFVARKPVHKILEARRDALRTKLSEAHEALELARRKSLEYENKFASLQQDIENIRKKSIQEGLIERERIIAEAKQTAMRTQTEAQHQIAELWKNAQRELRKNLVQTMLTNLEAELTPQTLNDLDDALKQDAVKSIKSLDLRKAF